MELPLSEPSGYTQWDRLPIAYPRLHEGVRGVGSVDCHLRCIARVEPFELAARALTAPTPGRTGTTRHLAGLADDYRARCAEWATSDAAPHRRSIGQSLLVVAFGLAGPLSLLAVVIADPRLSSLRWWPVALMTAPIVLPLGFTALAAAARAAKPRVELGEAIRDRRCPDCAAPLDATAPAIPPTLVEGANVGPRSCPRCRRPWPLLPPPAGIAPYSRS